jgi:hypothetical protein
MRLFSRIFFANNKHSEVKRTLNRNTSKVPALNTVRIIRNKSCRYSLSLCSSTSSVNESLCEALFRNNPPHYVETQQTTEREKLRTAVYCSNATAI